MVQELERAQRRGLDLEEIEDCIREAVAETHDVSPHRIVLIRPGSLPKTTSGKIQRALTRRLFPEGRLELAVVGADNCASSGQEHGLQSERRAKDVSSGIRRN